MKVPFLDLRASYLELKAELDETIVRVLDSGWYVLGEEVDKFEANYAAYSEAAHCVGVGNGLEAIRLALLAMGLGPGDEVIVPSNTYIATWLAVSQCGATPVPVEPATGTFNIDPSKIEEAITSKTRAVIPVHLYGQPADLDPIIAVARRYGIFVLEDGAQAHGARYKGRRIGAHGDAVAWSFYPGKNLGAFGDAGAVTTDDPDLARRIRVLRNYGSERKYVNEVRGFNSRLDPIQAAALGVKLKYLDRWNQARRAIAQQYLSGLASSSLVLPKVDTNAEPVWHVFAVQSEDRNVFQVELAKSGIGTLIHYPIAPHLQEAYLDLGHGKGSFPLSEKIHDSVFSLPMYPQMDSEQVDAVIAACVAVKHRSA
ncbi:DegT/DnrJ/EryC1/StrS family aminotransferase [Arthrobacter alkaliphilus]|uniref:DegT/DnrJ/EryC1/StrS family aminotransferase n=1 Tax=Arthrobacter alkaliphilus TaxID=369936 RepID=UPI001F38A3F1|nr:DegT/DnrJ/EryC1/StrS family aminotransferase [Arthrobacter alkaliphilus]